MSKKSFLAQQKNLADEAFENFNFAPEITVQDCDNWDIAPNDGMDDYSRMVWVSLVDDPADSDSHLVSFHVKFKAGTHELDEVYAYWMASGAELVSSFVVNISPV